MSGPQAGDEKEKHRGAGDCKRCVIEEPDRQGAEDERASRAPEPQVLMKHVEDSDEQRGNTRAHGERTVLRVLAALK
jgi:hypothetical protein